MYGVFPCDQDVACFLIKGHAVDCTACIFQYARRLTLASTSNCKREDPVRRGDKECGNGMTMLDFQSGDRLLRLKDNTLSSPSIIDKIAPNDSNRTVREADGNLGQIFKADES